MMAAKHPARVNRRRQHPFVLLAMGWTICLLCSLPACLGLAPRPLALLSRPSSTTSSQPRPPFGKAFLPGNGRASSQHAPSSTRLHNNGNPFDISKPTFDLLSFRLIRSDALLRYNSLNQSEPLRINLYLIGMVSLLGFPLWCESVTGDVAVPASIVGSTLSGLGCAALFWRERTRRSNQLYRMEKELNAERLEVRLPVNTALSSARPAATLKELRSKRRILAIRGSGEQLSGEVWTTLCTLRRRLVQSQTLVVLVPTDGSKREDWGWDASQMGSDALWLGEPLNADGGGGWIEYFSELLGDSGWNDGEIDNELAWFALNFKGRSIASGLGEPPRILELMGQQLQPMELLDDTDEAELSKDVVASKQILECQKKFYHVLTESSDDSDMAPVFAASQANEVNEVLEGGGRIDGWDKCLEPGARPAGMVISGSDAWVASPTLAYSTCVEFPPNAGFDGATLLAVQRWGREADGEEWKLELHQTIPWATGSRAGGTLRCDCRGCVALARGSDRRTFGGLIG